MKKIFALMLALTLLVSLIPMNAAAVGHWSTYGGATPANDGSGNMILTKWTLELHLRSTTRGMRIRKEILLGQLSG